MSSRASRRTFDRNQSSGGFVAAPSSQGHLREQPHTPQAPVDVRSSRRRGHYGRPQATVAFGAQDFILDGGTVRTGSFCAVSGNHVSQDIPSNLRVVSSTGLSTSDPDPSVLRNYAGSSSSTLPPGARFGEGSFAAVSRHQDIITIDGDVWHRAGTDSTHILPHQFRLPSVNTQTGTFAPGEYSAVAGYQDSEPMAPDVLMMAQNFHAEGGDFREGSFCAVAVQYFFAPFILALAVFVFIIRQTVQEAAPPSHNEAAAPTISDVANRTTKAPLKQDINPGKESVKTQKSTAELSQNLDNAHSENASMIVDAQPEGKPQEENTVVVSAPSVFEGAKGLTLRGTLVQSAAFMAISGNLSVGYDGHSQEASRIPSNSLRVQHCPSVLRNAVDINIDRDTEVHEAALTAVDGNVSIRLQREHSGDLALHRGGEGLPDYLESRRL
ncbi:hypothetical protein D9757_009395 [Collybiopsis confluens]|uniref:Uncharacterized protein n=1 Tax=Collybiopsis confluens TaxID=2823264 RepID=A0A8H5M206_9AGAR|nr:hypothetical protein D9757_009395 [Collybiopsis confluens]